MAVAEVFAKLVGPEPGMSKLGVMHAAAQTKVLGRRAMHPAITLGFFPADLEHLDEVKHRRKFKAVPRRKPPVTIQTNRRISDQADNPTRPDNVELETKHKADLDLSVVQSEITVKSKDKGSKALEVKKSKKKTAPVPKEDPDEAALEVKEYDEFLAAIEPFSTKRFFNVTISPKTLTASSRLDAEMHRGVKGAKAEPKEVKDAASEDSTSRDDLTAAKKKPAKQKIDTAQRRRRLYGQKRASGEEQEQTVDSATAIKMKERGRTSLAERQIHETAEEYNMRMCKHRDWMRRHVLLHLNQANEKILSLHVVRFLHNTKDFIHQQRKKFYYSPKLPEFHAINARTKIPVILDYPTSTFYDD